MLGKIMLSIQDRVLLFLFGVVVSVVGLFSPESCKRGLGWDDYD